MGTPADNESNLSSVSPGSREMGVIGRIMRLVLPVALLVIGWFAFSQWIEPETKEKKAPGMPQAPKTKVVELEVVDFEPRIETSGVVRAHNEITLT